MCLDAKSKFLTFVVVFQIFILPGLATGAPTTDIPPGGIILNDDSEYFYPRKTVTDSTDFSLGYAQGIFDKDKKKDTLGLFSIGRSHFQDNKTAYDYKLVLTSETLLGIDLGYRWQFPEILKEEPFVEIGTAIFLDPKDQIGNFIDYQRYYLQAAIGFDNLFRSRRALRIELGGRAGTAGTHAFAAFTYGWAD